MPSILNRLLRVSQESQSERTDLQFQTVGDISEMGRMVGLVESANRARDASEAVGEILAIREHVEDTQEIITDLNNDDQGMSLETACSVAQQCITLSTMLGIEKFRDIVNLDKLSKTGNVISTEMFEAILPSLKAASDQALRESEGALNELSAALREALPEAKDRLCGLLAGVSVRRDAFATELELDSNVLNGLSTSNGLPENLLSYAMQYADYGRTIVGPYLEKSKIMASQAQTILSGLSYESPEAFWKTFKERVDALGDPRTAFATDRLEFELPGVGALFDDGGAQIDVGNEVVRDVMEFVENHRPLTELQGGGAASGNTLPAPTRDELENILKALIALHDNIDLSEVFEVVRGTWKATQSAVAESREVIRNSSGATGFAIGNEIHLIPRYLKVVHELSVWPVLNFLTNLVMYSNAVVAVAESALNSQFVEPEAEAPTDPLLEDGGDPTDPSAEPLGEGAEGVLDEGMDTLAPSEGLDDLPAPVGDTADAEAVLDPVPVAGDEMPLANDVAAADAAAADDTTEAVDGEDAEANAQSADDDAEVDATVDAIDPAAQETQEETLDEAGQTGELPDDIDLDAETTGAEEEEEEDNTPQV